MIKISNVKYAAFAMFQQAPLNLLAPFCCHSFFFSRIYIYMYIFILAFVFAAVWATLSPYLFCLVSNNTARSRFGSRIWISGLDRRKETTYNFIMLICVCANTHTHAHTEASVYGRVQHLHRKTISAT